MSYDLLENAIGETIDVLQPLFAKPKLTSTLLAKPPFRFIHDIVTATLNSTGFPKGYYTPDELDSSNFKESKTAKLAFLDKLIRLVNVGIGAAIEVSSVKIVSGLEPLTTNRLLQSFGRIALDETLDRHALIRRCLGESDVSEVRTETIPLDAAYVVANPIQKHENPTRVEVSTEGIRAVSQIFITERVSGCNEDTDQTRNMISKIVTKPKCTDTLLSKPPFRFIHDIIVAVGKATQFDLRLIFSEDELDSSKVTEKHAKLQFLEKLIDFTAKQIGAPIDVNPTKIIAGLEPERTRYFLQLFTVVATSKAETPTMSDEDEAVSYELQKLSTTFGVQSKMVHDDPASSSSLVVPTMRPATSNGTRPKVKHGKSDTSAAFAFGFGESERRFREDIPSTLHSMSAEEMGSNKVDANVKTSSLGNLFNSLSAKSNTRPATSHGTKPTNSKVALNHPLSGTEPDEMVRDAIPPSNHTAFVDENRMYHGEEPRRSNFDDAIPTDQTPSNTRTTSMGMPLKFTGIDFIALASSVRHIAESTSSVGKYIDNVQNDLETLLNERNHWIKVQHNLTL